MKLNDKQLAMLVQAWWDTPKREECMEDLVNTVFPQVWTKTQTARERLCADFSHQVKTWLLRTIK